MWTKIKVSKFMLRTFGVKLDNKWGEHDGNFMASYGDGQYKVSLNHSRKYPVPHELNIHILGNGHDKEPYHFV